MKIQISDNLIKHYLKNVYFINGHSYAGKSTMVKMLSERYGMIHCGENYHDAFPRDKLSRWKQPGLCYFDTMSGWEEWLSMTPEEHWNWTEQVSRECVEVEILELLRLSAGGEKVMMEQIQRCRDPEAALKNFRAWTLYHPPMEADWRHTGFFTYTRSDFESDTREEVLHILAEHFGL